MTSPDAQRALAKSDAEQAAWLADKIVACGDYAKEAAAMLRRWPDRFFMDHALWHDRQTGQHLYTQDQFDAAVREARSENYNLASERRNAHRQGFMEGMSAATHRNLVALLRRGLAQLDAWQKAYGEHQPAWLPPAGDVRWMEDVQDLLDGSAARGQRPTLAMGAIPATGSADGCEAREAMPASRGPNGQAVLPDPLGDAALLREAAEALETLSMWAEGSEAHPRLIRVAALLRQRLEGSKG